MSAAPLNASAAASSGAAVSLQTVTDGLLTRVPGCQVILVTDPDGAVILQSTAADATVGADEGTVAALAAQAVDQANRLNLGTSQLMTTFWHNGAVATYVVDDPVVVAFLGSSTMNAGLVRELSDDLVAALEPLKKVVSLAVEHALNQ